MIMLWSLYNQHVFDISATYQNQMTRGITRNQVYEGK